jgi:Xaa-Pro aminopeptidase
MDWGAQVDGWCSDCTRTIATGPISDEARAVYDLVLRAQEAALAEVRAGRDGAELDGIAREIITEAGYGERFGHGLGHGVGMEIHEGPRVSRRGSSVLRAGNVVTIEPGVYLPGELGVRIEDLVIVEEDGFEVISSLPKGLWTIDTVAS